MNDKNVIFHFVLKGSKVIIKLLTDFFLVGGSLEGMTSGSMKQNVDK
jgi:hypothetical protein